MTDRWPLDATGEERSLRLFKDALMGHAATAVVLSAKDEEDRGYTLSGSRRSARSGKGATTTGPSFLFDLPTGS